MIENRNSQNSPETPRESPHDEAHAERRAMFRAGYLRAMEEHRDKFKAIRPEQDADEAGE